MRATSPASQLPDVEPGDRALTVALLVAIVLGAVVRGWHILGVDFPLNDGGLFLEMVRDLQRAQYRLPAFTSYNDARIPFGYSPFAFYVTAVLNDLTGVSLFTLFRVLPLVVSTACIPAFYLLARELLPSRRALAAAVIAFAVIPRGFVWLLMGGGLTRSFGYLFALLTLHQLWRLYTGPSLRPVPLAALFAALTVLSHLGTAPFVAFSAVLFLLVRGRHWQAVIGSALAGAGALVLTAPWWASVMARHGVAPFLAAQATGGSSISSLPDGMPDSLPDTGERLLGALEHFARDNTGEGWFPFFFALAVLGTIWCIRKRTLLLPAWWVAILVLDVRAGFTYATAPVAMLAGISAAHMFWPLLASRTPSGRSRVPRWSAAASFTALLLLAIVGAASRRHDFDGETRVLRALSPEHRLAMRWIADNTSPTSQVLVLSDGPWQLDKFSEWLPVIAARPSVATVQGSEWLPAGSFDSFIERQRRVNDCARGDTSCLDALRAEPTLRFTHVYAPVGPRDACCGPLVDALRQDPRFALVFENTAAQVYEWSPVTASARWVVP
ncbi:MAG: glycosyltransferase family 39 protein [Gemmatimonadota bacterium]